AAWTLIQFRKIRNGILNPKSLSEQQISIHNNFVHNIPIIKEWYEKTSPDIGSYDFIRAIQESTKWLKDLQQSKDQIVFTTSNGWTIRKLKKEEECSIEGELMGHCVGDQGSDVE